MAKTSETKKMLSWEKTGTTLILSIDGIEKFRTDCTEYPQEIQTYAMLDRFQNKLGDTCARPKEEKLTADECLAEVTKMHEQLMSGRWNSGTKASGGETAKLGKQFKDALAGRSYEELKALVLMNMITQEQMDVQVAARKLTPNVRLKKKDESK